ncbi:hypothetical protein ACLOJK_029363 [Asimina triloba]
MHAEPVLPENDEDLRKDDEKSSLNLDGGFVVPDSNAFGHSFRDYEKESDRRDGVEDFYTKNHINQTYEFNT